MWCHIFYSTISSQNPLKNVKCIILLNFGVFLIYVYENNALLFFLKTLWKLCYNIVIFVAAFDMEFKRYKKSHLASEDSVYKLLYSYSWKQKYSSSQV